MERCRRHVSALGKHKVRFQGNYRVCCEELFTHFRPGLAVRGPTHHRSGTNDVAQRHNRQIQTHRLKPSWRRGAQQRTQARTERSGVWYTRLSELSADRRPRETHRRCLQHAPRAKTRVREARESQRGSLRRTIFLSSVSTRCDLVGWVQVLALSRRRGVGPHLELGIELCIPRF